ncbi:arrestin domain-containing protein 17 [Hyalella azteca]|uniref:Arrestin domain-containing protein 17 n=1 Tax=Hyalella azteca TaxID=294128 RepID=A0A979FT15_HYAAZ|nr:arrestin domain-containing protein 17 [Hyalella azteca]
MGIEDISVFLEPHQDIYFPGQAVMGQVKVQSSSDTSCRAIVVEFKGKAKVHWSVKEGDNTKHFTSREEYFKFKTSLWSSRSSEKLSSGNHAWPFNFQLPFNIPSSFEGTVGYIRYSIKANADIPMGVDHKKKIFISINCPFDLNCSDSARVPLVIQTSDTSCCLCCVRGPVDINVRCVHSGAVVGEGYRVRGEVTNNGSKEVGSTVVALYQHVTYHAE